MTFHADQIGWACLLMIVGVFLVYLIGKEPDEDEDTEEFKRRLR